MQMGIQTTEVISLDFSESIIIDYSLKLGIGVNSWIVVNQLLWQAADAN